MVIKRILDKLHSRPLVWDTITTTFFSTIGKAVGFLVPFFIAAWFGITSKTDAFFFAYGVIFFLSGIFASAVESVIVPYVSETSLRKEDVGQFVGNVLAVSGLGLIVLTGILIWTIKPILSVITSFDKQTLSLIFQLILESAPLIILLVWASVLTGSLNAYKKFAFPALSPAIRAVANLTIIFALKDSYGVHSIVLGYVIGETARLIVLFFVIKKYNLFKLSFSFQLTSKIKRFFGTASYQMTGVVAAGLNPFIDKTMASWLGAGNVSILYYADKLYTIPVTFIASGLMVTVLSHWSSQHYSSGQSMLDKKVQQVAKMTGFMIAPLALLLIIFHQPIVTLAFNRGAFDQSKLPEVGQVWICYLLGLTPYMIGSIFVRAFLTLKRTDILMTYGFITLVLKILFNYVLMKFFGLLGIALSTMLIYFFCAFCLRACFLREMKRQYKRE